MHAPSRIVIASVLSARCDPNEDVQNGASPYGDPPLSFPSVPAGLYQEARAGRRLERPETEQLVANLTL
jgi:hypothetical protein